MKNPSHWDVVVAGLGAMGSAALYQCALRGAKVLGLERHGPSHEHGSSHGESRITRLALGEGEAYVPFVRRSHEIWRRLENETGRQLLRQIGGLVYGSSQCRSASHGAQDFLQTTFDVARRHGISHEVLSASQIADRFPQFRLQGDEWGYFEPEAGLVHPEECVAAQREVALRHGAEVRFGEAILSWESKPDGIHITTEKSCVIAQRLIVCAGPWIPQYFPLLKSLAKVFRQILFWFEPEGDPALFMPERLPIYIRVPELLPSLFYGFPLLHGVAGGLKIAGEHFDQESHPDDPLTPVTPEEIEAMHDLASPYLRITRRCVRAVRCHYTVTPDFHFIIDHAPDDPRVQLASACSGHGFKHSAAVGEALAEVALQGKTALPLDAFRLSRFAQGQ